jgi:hypothetical protein
MKRRPPLDAALRRPQLHISRSLDNGRAIENLVDAVESILRCLAETWDFVIHVIQQIQSDAFSLCISEPVYGFLGTLQNAGEAAAAFHGDACPVARELIEDGSRQDDLHTVLPDKFVQHAEKRLLLIIFRQVKPHTGVDEYPKQGIFSVLRMDKVPRHNPRKQDWVFFVLEQLS